MPKVPTTSPITGAPTAPHYIHTLAGHFLDARGRTLLLRGINLSGASKAPVDRPSWNSDGFFDTAEAGGESFVGRPLDLDDGSADVHLARLRGWGFNMIRYVVTWEALEHEGPGKYDYEFMDYTVKVLQKCKEYGFKVFMDPHQDIWSRFSGGSGAPIWTLHACGMQPRNFTATQATLLHCEYPSAKDPEPVSFPAMIWSTDYQRLAAQTLFAMFFGGRDFAPKCVIDGVNIQDYLQTHFNDAVCLLAEKIRDAGDLFDECVIGWDPMNEPSEGFIGHADLREVPKEQTLRKGSCPSGMQGLRLGMGERVEVDYYEFGSMGPKRTGSVTIDPKGRRAWLKPDAEPHGVSALWGWTRDPGWKLGVCPWALHGVWDPSSDICLMPDYFAHPPARPEKDVVFVRDYWLPTWTEYVRRIRAIHTEAIVFVQPPVFVPPPPIPAEILAGRACYSPHYYDGLTLMTRHWNWFNADALGLLRGKYASMYQAIKIGETMIRRSLREQLAMFKDDVAKVMGAQYPTLIGEIGTPFDMDGKRAYGYTDNGRYKGDYSAQQKALDASLNATDGTNLLDFTIWTYVPDSSHEWGDGWNMEDLSLYSDDDLKNPQQDGAFRSYAPSASSSVTSLSASFAGPPTQQQLQPLLSLGVGMASTASLTMTKQLAPTASMSQLSLPLKTSPYLAVPAMDYATGNLYRFLTNGARAYRAFSRPFPSAVVGTPTDIEFDIASADFRLTVVVAPEDAPAKRPDDDDDDEGAPTEVYIPVIHYASNAQLLRGEKKTRVARFRPRSAFLRSRSTVSLAVPGPKGAPARSALSLQIPTVYEHQAQTAPATPMTESPSTPVGFDDCSPMSLNASSTTLVTALIDIDVQVSEGRFEVEGQTLRWWYPVPPAGAAQATYTLRVRRRQGPIRLSREEESNWEKCWNPEEGVACAVS